jgi:hypothetical protein
MRTGVNPTTGSGRHIGEEDAIKLMGRNGYVTDKNPRWLSNGDKFNTAALQKSSIKFHASEADSMLKPALHPSNRPGILPG